MKKSVLFLVVILIFSMFISCGGEVGSSIVESEDEQSDSSNNSIDDGHSMVNNDVKDDGQNESKFFTDFEGVWEMDTSTVNEIQSDCVALLKNGVAAKPYRKIVKLDDQTISLIQCKDKACENEEYEIGEFKMNENVIDGNAVVTEKVATWCVKSVIEPNQIILNSNNSATVYNNMKVTFYKSNCEDELTYPAACVHEIEYEINKVD